MIAALAWIISLSLPNDTYYLKKVSGSYVLTPAKAKATKYRQYKTALADRVKLLGKGQNFEINVYEKEK